MSAARAAGALFPLLVCLPLSTHGQGVQVVTIHSTIGETSSLRVSRTYLEVHAGQVPDNGAVDLGTIVMEAGARTRAGGEVLLTVEALFSVDGLAAWGPGLPSVEFVGEGDGMQGGTLSASPQVAGRWTGSGRHSGRLSFVLRGARTLRNARLPVRLAIVIP